MLLAVHAKDTATSGCLWHGTLPGHAMNMRLQMPGVQQQHGAVHK
jgi:hypothetical protein